MAHLEGNKYGGKVVDIKEADVDDLHTHPNQTELDLVTDGNHDVRTDNPHNVTTFDDVVCHNSDFVFDTLEPVVIL